MFVCKRVHVKKKKKLTQLFKIASYVEMQSLFEMQVN